ncbi:hypothetical protein Tco_1193590 [Tanacetum coccineum]
MLNLKFVKTHNLVAFLEKPKERDRFEGIIDFLNESSIRYALMVNPTIYTSCIKQFWATAKAKTINGEVKIQALVDGKKVIVSEKSVRRAIQLKDVECLPNANIFAELERIGAKTTTWNELNETENVESVPIHSNDQLLNEITKLKKRVKKLERRNKSRTPELKRLRNVGRTAIIESSKDEGLGAQEDASKQGRKIVDLDADAEVTLGKIDDNLMFDTGVFDEQEVEIKKAVSTAEVTTSSATTTTVDELTLAQTLIKIKAAKPTAITTAAITITTAVTRPKARGVIKDKGKAKMIEPEKPLKRKDQILVDEEIAQRLQEELQDKLEEEERLARKKKKRIT